MRVLFTTFEGGGHVPPALLVASGLQSRGHEVLFVSDPANAPQAQALGLRFAAWRTAPRREALGAADDPLEDWKTWWPPAVVRSVCDGVLARPAGAYAADTAAQIESFRPDLVVSNELLFGAMMAAEAARRPLALLTSNVWCFPTRPDVPPFGPGFPPATDGFGARRNASSRRMIAGWYDAGLADLNAARDVLGLPPLVRALDQLYAADAVLLGASAAFDYGCVAPPAPFHYVGPLGARPAWASEAVAVARDAADGLPLVLVSFSTTHQGQADIVARCIRALRGLPVQGVVTLGPALAGARLPAAPNVEVVAHADHDALVPRCALVICHGGHGTVLRPLMHGVPVICIPTGRDQPENAQRIAEAGAGLRLPRSPTSWRIRRAARRVLGDPVFQARAAALGDEIRASADGGWTACERLEALVSAGGSSRRPGDRPG